MQVSLWKNNKSREYKVHRIVAEAFIPNPSNLPQVNHIDGDKDDKAVSGDDIACCEPT